MENNEKVINMEPKNEREESIKRKANLIKDIVIKSAKEMLDDQRLYQTAAVVGLVQGLKYRGSLGRGLRASVATVGVAIGTKALWNIYHSSDEIKKA